MSFDLFKINEEIFEKIIFSDTGTSEFENDIFEFYKDITNSTFFKDNFSILSGAYVLLQNYTQWQSRSFKKIYWHIYTPKKDIETVLNIYFFLSNYNFENKTIEKPYISSSLFFATIFKQRIDIRINATKKDKPDICFYPDQSILSFEVPCSIFKANNKKLLFSTLERRYTFIIKNLNDSICEYNAHIEQNLSLIDNYYQDYYESLIEHQKAIIVLEQINNQFKYLLSQYPELTIKLSDIDIYKLCKVVIALSFLSKFYESTIEYILSCAKYDKINNEYRNLGGFIIGYQKELWW